MKHNFAYICNEPSLLASVKEEDADPELYSRFGIRKMQHYSLREALKDHLFMPSPGTGMKAYLTMNQCTTIWKYLNTFRENPSLYEKAMKNAPENLAQYIPTDGVVFADLISIFQHGNGMHIIPWEGIIDKGIGLTTFEGKIDLCDYRWCPFVVSWKRNLHRFCS